MKRKKSKISAEIKSKYVSLLRSQQRKLQAQRESRIVTAQARIITQIFQQLRQIYQRFTGENKVQILREKYEFAIQNRQFTDLNPNGNSDYFMGLLLDSLSRDRFVDAMQIGNIYTFLYHAKTPKKWYDAHPVTVIVGVYSWGYRGYNYHWERANGYIESPIRNYSFGNIQSMKFRILPQELEDVLRIPTFKPIYKY